MAKFQDVLGRLSEDEKRALGILKKNGWMAFVDLSVEKAVIEESAYATYSVGGYYDIGFLKMEMPLPKKKKTGRKS